MSNPSDEKRVNCALRPDAQGFDEVRVVTVPRYKESELSGDEWRISASIQFWRKGKLIYQSGCRDIEAAMTMIGGEYLRALDNAHGYFAGDGVHCDQEGCSDAATVRYRLKKRYCKEGHEHSGPSWDEYRHFCDRHKRRGDCALEDADRNYIQVPLT